MGFHRRACPMEERLEDRWKKLEEIVESVLNKVLDEREIKKKTPIRFENGTWQGITTAQLSSWEAAYGSVDIQGELKKAAAWLLSNPGKAPKRDIPRFLNAWFSRQQDRSSIRLIPTRNEQAEKKTCRYCPNAATGTVNGIAHCRAHTTDAMDERAA